MYLLTPFTFSLTFLLLSFSTVITGIESLKTENLKLRTVLTLETFISLVAGYIYYKYLLNQPDDETATNYRYLDWFITTPFLLLSLCIILNDEKDFPWTPMIIIIILNQLMIIFGYISEKSIYKLNAYIVSTLCLIGIFLIIGFYFKAYTKGIFWVFVVLWSCYGIIYFLPKEIRTPLNNILDLIAKVGFGFWTWLVAVDLVPTNYRIANK